MSFQMYVPTEFYLEKGAARVFTSRSCRAKGNDCDFNGKSTKRNGALEKTEKELKLAGAEAVLFDKIMPNPLKQTIMEEKPLRKKITVILLSLLAAAVLWMHQKLLQQWRQMTEIYGTIFPEARERTASCAGTASGHSDYTTAGTGSEVDQWGVVSNGETDEKIGFGGYDSLFPQIAIVDPQLMKSVPAEFTAYQGFDALFHSVECYISAAANLMSDMYAP